MKYWKVTYYRKGDGWNWGYASSPPGWSAQQVLTAIASQPTVNDVRAAVAVNPDEVEDQCSFEFYD